MARAKVLVVEDETRLQQVLKLTLEASGYAVEAVGTAADAVLCILAARPDVLVLDVNLPDGTGWGVLQQVGSGLRLPTIVVSAEAPAPGRLAEFQPRAFLLKPFAVGALLRLIAEALAAQRGAV